MKVIAVGGEPATGKTTMMKLLMSRIPGEWRARKYGLLTVEKNDIAKVVILGIYRGGSFEGTDRLPMNVQPDAERFLKLADTILPGYKIVFEGDRLCNAKFFQAAENFGHDFCFWCLNAPESTLEARHSDRADTQSGAFLKGRKTKYERLQSAFKAETRPNTTGPELEAIIVGILSSLGIQAEPLPA